MLGINLLVALTVHEISPLFTARSNNTVVLSRLKCMLCSTKLIARSQIMIHRLSSGYRSTAG